MTDAIAGVQDSTLEPVNLEPAPAAIRDDEALLRLYVGKNADKFLNLFQARKNQGSRWFQLSSLFTSFNWIAGIFGLPWFFYRKLYLEGAALLLVPIALIYIFPDLDKIHVGISTVIAFGANTYYLERALKRIRKIEAMPIPVSERDDLIRKSGGTSIAGAILGAVIILGAIGAAIGSGQTNASLPACDAELTRSLVSKHMTETFSAKNLPTDKVTYDQFIAFGAPSASKRPCQVTIVNEGQVAAIVRFDITWADDTHKSVLMTYNPDKR